jgi:hypothetical protein
MAGSKLHGLSTKIDINHFHLFCGLGGGAKGYNRGQARVGTLEANFRCLDRGAIAGHFRTRKAAWRSWRWPFGQIVGHSENGELSLGGRAV